MVSLEGIFLVGSSLMILSATGFFDNLSLSDTCGVALVVVVAVIGFTLVVVVVVSTGLACFIVECDFALLVMFGLSSDAAVRC